MKSMAGIAGALLFAALLVPTAKAALEMPAFGECKGPYQGIRLTQQKLQEILDDSRSKRADPNLCGANLEELDLSQGNLSGAILSDANLRRAILVKAELSQANLFHANLSGANLSAANLSNANLSNANLSGAYLSDANLSRAILGNANLSGANLSNANLKGADLRDANLSGANLSNANLSGADLSRAKLQRAIFEPQDLPDTHRMTYAIGLSEMISKVNPTALVTARDAFKKAGLREQERQVTCAIKRSETADSNWLEHGFNLVLFDLTSQYGMSPGRPLRILGFLIFVFVLPYAIALKRQSGGGIWMIWSKERILMSEGMETPVRMTRKGLGLLWTAFYFSLLSAFNIGWREINVGNWISRLQSHEYTMRATGVSGVVKARHYGNVAELVDQGAMTAV
jgi:hypothetical protein